MSQADTWYYDDPWGKYTIVACDRNGCTVQAKAFAQSGPWELLTPYDHLLPDAEPSARPRNARDCSIR